MKHYFRQWMVVVGLATAVSGCATRVDFSTQINPWIGKSISEARQFFGYNFIERQVDNNHTATTWTRSFRGTTVGYATPTEVHTYKVGDREVRQIIPGTLFPPEVYENSCEFTLISNDKSIIDGWRAHGNGCSTFVDTPTFSSE